MFRDVTPACADAAGSPRSKDRRPAFAGVDVVRVHAMLRGVEPAQDVAPTPWRPNLRMEPSF